MPARHRRSIARSGARRRTAWATVTATHSVPAANGYDVIDLLAQYKAAVGASTDGITIARVHLREVVTSTLAAGNNFQTGIIVTDLNDLGTNVPGAPRPAADLHLDWYLWDWQYVDRLGMVNEQGAANTARDLRSKRKMHQVSNVLGHVVQVPAASTFPFVMNVTGRILLMLP
jgi:hypothetical protein